MHDVIILQKAVVKTMRRFIAEQVQANGMSVCRVIWDTQAREGIFETFLIDLLHFLGVEMPSYCCVPLCKGFGGHLFPRDNATRRAWIAKVRRGTQGGKNWTPSKHSVICQEHFLASDYISVGFHGKLLE